MSAHLTTLVFPVLSVHCYDCNQAVPVCLPPLVFSLCSPRIGFRLIVQVLCPDLRFVVAPVSWDEVYICFGYWGTNDFHFNLSSHLLVAFVVAINSPFFPTCFFDRKMLILFKKKKNLLPPWAVVTQVKLVTTFFNSTFNCLYFSHGSGERPWICICLSFIIHCLFTSFAFPCWDQWLRQG